jgi:hypothetical protein
MTQNLNFGRAIEALKEGKKVARNGWNGKGMFLYLKEGVVNSAYVLEEEAAGETLKTEFNGVSAKLFEPHAGDLVTVYPSICMWTATQEIVLSWNASTIDMLAEDWCIVE